MEALNVGFEAAHIHCFMGAVLFFHANACAFNRVPVANVFYPTPPCEPLHPILNFAFPRAFHARHT